MSLSIVNFSKTRECIEIATPGDAAAGLPASREGGSLPGRIFVLTRKKPRDVQNSLKMRTISGK
jgi:hypothetical protein